MPEEKNKKELLKNLSKCRREIIELKLSLNQLDNQKEECFKKKEKASNDLSNLFKKIKELKNSRNSLTKKVKELKSKRENYNKLIKEKISEIKNVLDTSRKYMIPLMEYLDSIGFTKRAGDKRVLGG